MIHPLSIRLYGYLAATHAQWGVEMEPIEEMLGRDDVELHALGQAGVLAFVGDYVLAAWPPDDQVRASRDCHRVLSKRLRERGFTLHMVYIKNSRSGRITRKIGALPLGIDADGFVHYRLDSERFPFHGQEISSPEAA